MKWLDRIVGTGESPDLLVEEAPKKDPDVNPDATFVRWDGLGKIPFTNKKWNELIATTPEQHSELASRESFVDLMQAKTLIDDEVLFRDGKTVGAVFEVVPVEADGRTDAFMNSLHHKIMSVLRDSIPRDLDSPWIAQVTMRDDADVQSFTFTAEQAA